MSVGGNDCNSCLPLQDGWRQYVEGAALGIVCVLGACCNGFVVFLFSRRRSMRTFSNRFVLSLTVSHLLQSVLVIPSVLISTLTNSWPFGDAWCSATVSLTIALNVASVLSILLIAADRNRAVNSPLRYALQASKRGRASMLIAMVWGVAFLFALPPLGAVLPVAYRPEWHTCVVLWNSGDVASLVYRSLLSIIGFVVPLLNVTWMYFVMFRAAKSSDARARKNSVTSISNDLVVSLKPTKAGDYHSYSLRRNVTDQPTRTGCFSKHRAARTGFLVVVSFVFCWLPFFLSIVSEPFLQWSEGFRFVVSFTAFSACLINPYLYVFRNKNSRTHARSLIERHMQRNRDFYSVRNNADRISKSVNQAACVLHMAKTVIASPSSLEDSNGYQSRNYESSKFQGAQIFLLNPTRPLLHQDSSSSSDSSDLGFSPTAIDTVINVDDDSTSWYHQLQHRINQDAMIEVSLKDDVVKQNIIGDV